MFDFKHKKLPQLTFSFFYAFQPKIVFYPWRKHVFCSILTDRKRTDQSPSQICRIIFYSRPPLSACFTLFLNSAASRLPTPPQRSRYRGGALTSIPTEAEVTALISGTDNG